MMWVHFLWANVKPIRVRFVAFTFISNEFAYEPGNMLDAFLRGQSTSPTAGSEKAKKKCVRSNVLIIKSIISLNIRIDFDGNKLHLPVAACKTFRTENHTHKNVSSCRLSALAVSSLAVFTEQNQMNGVEKNDKKKNKIRIINVF